MDKFKKGTRFVNKGGVVFRVVDIVGPCEVANRGDTPTGNRIVYVLNEDTGVRSKIDLALLEILDVTVVDE